MQNARKPGRCTRDEYQTFLEKVGSLEASVRTIQEAADTARINNKLLEQLTREIDELKNKNRGTNDDKVEHLKRRIVVLEKSMNSATVHYMDAMAQISLIRETIDAMGAVLLKNCKHTSLECLYSTLHDLGKDVEDLKHKTMKLKKDSDDSTFKQDILQRMHSWEQKQIEEEQRRREEDKKRWRVLDKIIDENATLRSRLEEMDTVPRNAKRRRGKNVHEVE